MRHQLDEMITLFPELILGGAVLHLALRRFPEGDPADGQALKILRLAYIRVQIERVRVAKSSESLKSADKP